MRIAQLGESMEAPKAPLPQMSILASFRQSLPKTSEYTFSFLGYFNSYPLALSPIPLAKINRAAVELHEDRLGRLLYRIIAEGDRIISEEDMPRNNQQK